MTVSPIDPNALDPFEQNLCSPEEARGAATRWMREYIGNPEATFTPGHIGEPSCCVMAKTIPGVAEVEPRGTMARPDCAILMDDDESFDLPDAVAMFVHYFDSGLYPDLVISRGRPLGEDGR